MKENRLHFATIKKGKERDYPLLKIRGKSIHSFPSFANITQYHRMLIFKKKKLFGFGQQINFFLFKSINLKGIL